MPVRPLLALVVAAFLVLVPRVVFAQSITIAQEQSLPRVDGSGASVGKRPTNLDPEAVSNQDCIDDQRIRFSLTLDGFQPNASLQAWASVGGTCTELTQRQGGTQVCWPLVSGIPLQTTTQVDIPVRAIMAGAPPGSAASLLQGDEMCGQIDLTSVSVSFLYFAPGQPGTAATSKNITVKVDTVGPEPPTGLKTLPGNTRVHIQWDNVSGEGGVAALTGVNLYCEAAGVAPAVTTEASTTIECDDGGIFDASDEEAGAQTGCQTVTKDGGTQQSTSACQSEHLTSADGKPIFATSAMNVYKCGSITGNTGSGATAESLNGGPLVNGQRYAVAVAATDALGNVGRLSEPVCEIPELTTDFWDDYRKNGGGAGGGFCSTNGAGLPVGTATGIGCALVMVASMLRKKSSKRKKER